MPGRKGRGWGKKPRKRFPPGRLKVLETSFAKRMQRIKVQMGEQTSHSRAIERESNQALAELRKTRPNRKVVELGEMLVEEGIKDMTKIMQNVSRLSWDVKGIVEAIESQADKRIGIPEKQSILRIKTRLLSMRNNVQQRTASLKSRLVRIKKAKQPSPNEKCLRHYVRSMNIG